ncbi:gamma-tubulin complex component 3 homolog isoform X2 [Zootermopsis nevadensis]|nr:gamma-tubulin complex component 3 homolog isoform X2 [Zootermopsis nevadensis]
MSKTNTASGGTGSTKLIQKLCYHLSGKRRDDAARLFKFTIQRLYETPHGDRELQDEYSITDIIKKRLAETRTEKEVCIFNELHRKLQTDHSIKNHQSILLFLMHVSDIRQVNYDGSSSPLFKGLIASESAEPIHPSSFGLPRLSSSSIPSTQAAPGIPSDVITVRHTDQNWRQDNRRMENVSQSSQSSLRQSSESHVPSVANLNKPVFLEVPESQLLQDLIYSFQGIDGKVLKLSPVGQGYKLDPKVRVKRSVRRYVLRLAELGWLHNQVRQHCENAACSKTQGLIGQSLSAAFREELTEYYRFVAILQSQIKLQMDTSVDSPLSEEQPLYHRESLTLFRLTVWAFEPQRRMKCLVAVADACKDKKGGEMASCVHGFLQHGDPVIRETAKNLLGAVCKPLYVMLSRWILDGELEDPYSEFFIAADLEVKGDLLWHEKYRVLESMVPSFIPLAQAKKILATGKSINFLREICQDHTPVKGREELKHALACANVESLFMADRDSDLQSMIDTAYLETSRRVLDVLIGQYKFLDHLQALRRYLLLGQGDFIRHLMELLEPELIKPAIQLYPHNLSGILESAIRATNAQFEDADILNRLDVRFLEQSPGDTGWDVFSLDYHVDGPIGTIFTQNSTAYLMLFSALWRAKRMEWILSGMWKRQITSAKLLRKLPELGPILQRAHLLTSEMVHFIHQMQYYILFEVLECSWDVLIKQVHRAESLDDIISAHEYFLITVKAGALLDDNSQKLSTQLRTVYELILQLQSLEEELHARSLSELQALAKHEELVEERGKLGQFGTSTHEEELYHKQSQDFKQRYITSVQTQLRILSKSYQDVVKKFLLMLASQSDVSLQLLSFRLDFNEHYKRLDSRLRAPLTYQHRRLSEMGSGKNIPGASQQK